ncbi:hypothetical protein [Tenacibaculum discolor]|uniref:hypothetical protein n=1 Tax=Tenacibaculum discolor TaxID=361581 RepID=UPI003F7908C3
MEKVKAKLINELEKLETYYVAKIKEADNDKDLLNQMTSKASIAKEFNGKILSLYNNSLSQFKGEELKAFENSINSTVEKYKNLITSFITG